MSLGVSTNDLAVLIIGALLALFVPIVLLAIGALIGRIFGVRLGIFPLLFLVVVGFGALVGGSLYLDAAGRTFAGRVISKQEKVTLREQGDWSYALSAELHYRLDGTLPEGEYMSRDVSSVSLRLSQSQFDALRTGDTPQIKVLPIWHTVTLVRLANTSTRELLPWNWIAIGTGVVVLGWLLFTVARSWIGWRVGVLVGVVVVLVVPAVIVYREWQAMENLAAKPLRATATVEKVSRVTRIDPMPCYNRCSESFDTEFDVPQQYNIVQMRFTPQNARDSVLAIDAVDVDSASVQNAGTVDIAYAAADPRAAQIIGGTHSHHWKNMLGFLQAQLLELLVLAVFLLVVTLVSRVFKRAVRRATARP